MQYQVSLGKFETEVVGGYHRSSQWRQDDTVRRRQRNLHAALQAKASKKVGLPWASGLNLGRVAIVSKPKSAGNYLRLLEVRH
jgi:hypothetical protein